MFLKNWGLLPSGGSEVFLKWFISPSLFCRMLMLRRRKGKTPLTDSLSQKKLHPALLQTLPLFNFLFIHSTNPNFPVVSAVSFKYSTGLLDIFGWFCPGYSCIMTWIIKYVWVSHFISHHITLLRTLMCIFLFYFSQPSDQHHDFTIVSYFRSFHIKSINHRLLFFFLTDHKTTGENKPIFQILPEKFSTCCLWFQNSFTDMAQLGGNVAFTETFYAGRVKSRSQ